jgi:hypothetical protein
MPGKPSKYTGNRVEATKSIGKGIPAGEMGTLTGRRQPSGVVTVQFDNGIIFPCYRHEIKIFERHGIDEVEDNK